MDRFFKVKLLNQTINPNMLMYAALHQDYSEHFVADELNWIGCYGTASYYSQKRVTSEKQAGQLVVDSLLKGNRGHYGPLEHPQITFNVGYFPHSVMQQARTHRIGTSFDCQSFRYSGKRICKAVESENVKEAIESVFYFRPVGFYTDRQGKKYEYTECKRNEDIELATTLAIHYRDRVSEDFSEEHARSMIPFDTRQHFVVSFNLRSAMHFLDLRAKADAQLEIQWLCETMIPYLEDWVPEVWAFYEKNRLHRAKLAP